MTNLPASVRHLRDYVALPSVNPMGRSDVDPDIVGESRYARHVLEQLRALGLDAEQIGSDERPSVIAEATAPHAEDTVLVASHLDTVPVDGMEIEPFDPVIRDGRLYGRGSCDTKSGMAALVAALERVLPTGRLRRNVVIVGEADEELGSVGVVDVLEHLGTWRPDWVLATEPTGLRLVTRHKGIAVTRLHAEGKACHSSDPGAGRSAIVAISRAVLALQELAARLAEHPDPRLGPGTLSVGLVGGGQAPNIVPDSAWIVTDRRLLPGETAESVQAEIEAILEEQGVEGVRVTHCRVEKGALGTPDHHPCVRRCIAAQRALKLPTDPASVAFGTDAGVFASEGLPGVVMGPGSIDQAHTAREYVAIDQVEAMTDWFEHLLTTAD